MLRYNHIVLLSIMVSLHAGAAYELVDERQIVVIIPSYNNEEYYKGNLDSVFTQHYDNYRVIYINDASTDHTGALVEEYVREHDLSDRITIIHNDYNRKALMNIYKAVHMCDDDDLIVILDGDDAFAHDFVLTKINRMHVNDDVWASYAQFVNVPPSVALQNKLPVLGWAAETPKEIIDGKNYRWCYKWMWSGLRAFSGWIFKCVKLESLFLDTPPYLGKVLPIMYDAAILWPMMEMGGYHVQFNPNILLTRNMTPINDFNVAGELLKKAVRRVLRTQQAYPTVHARNDAATLHGRQENKGVDIVIFSDNDPRYLGTILKDVRYTCKGIHTRCVCYKTTRTHEARYTALAKKYPDVTFIQGSVTHPLSAQLVEHLQASTANHIILTTNMHDMYSCSDINTCIDQLERTYAYALYFDIDTTSFRSSEQSLASLPCEQLDGDIYAWQFKCWAPRDWRPNDVAPALYRKRDFLQVLNEHQADTVKQVVAEWRREVVDMHKIGLFLLRQKA